MESEPSTITNTKTLAGRYEIDRKTTGDSITTKQEAHLENGSRVSFGELISIVYGYFDRRATDLRVESAQGTVKCMLYESFEFECALDAQYQTFGAAIRVGPVLSTTEFFGERVAMSSEPEAIRASLALVERWCRLRLPDKFLDEYDRRVLAP